MIVILDDLLGQILESRNMAVTSKSGGASFGSRVQKGKKVCVCVLAHTKGGGGAVGGGGRRGV